MASKSKSEEKTQSLKTKKVNMVKLKDVLAKFFAFERIKNILSIIFYLIWILVGIFFIWFITANFRLGAFDQLIQGPISTQQSPQNVDQAPAETSVPGVGTVNVTCVQSNLSEEAIIKIVQDQGTQNLTEEEKTKLEPCIVERATSTPEGAPSPLDQQ